MSRQIDNTKVHNCLELASKLTSRERKDFVLKVLNDTYWLKPKTLKQIKTELENL